MPKIKLKPDEKAQLLQDATSKIIQLALHVRNKMDPSFVQPSVCLSQRGRIAGSALLNQHHIRLNAVLFQQNKEAFLNEVIAHEMAHLIVFQRFGKVKPHGCEWQSVMSEIFNCKPKTRHNFDVSDVQQKTYTYYCGCSEIELSQIRHNKCVSNKQSYICRTCKQP